MQYQLQYLIVARKPKTYANPNPKKEIYEVIPGSKDLKDSLLKSVVEGRLTLTSFNRSGLPHIDFNTIEELPKDLLTEQELVESEISYHRLCTIERKLNKKSQVKTPVLVKN